MPDLTYSQLNSVILKNAINFNITHNIRHLRDTDVFICVILDILKRVDDLHHYLNISMQGHSKT
jgi:hypothetical protein